MFESIDIWWLYSITNNNILYPFNINYRYFFVDVVVVIITFALFHSISIFNGFFQWFSQPSRIVQMLQFFNFEKSYNVESIATLFRVKLNLN